MEQHVKDYIRNLSVIDQDLDIDFKDQLFAYDYNEIQELLFDPDSNNYVFIAGESSLHKEDMLSRVCQDLYDRGIEKSSILYLDYDLPILHGEDVSGLIDDMYHSRPEERVYIVINEIQMINNWYSFVENLRIKYPRIQLLCSSSVAPLIYETMYDQDLNYCKVVVLSKKNESNTKNVTEGFGVYQEYKYNIKNGIVEIKGLTKEGKMQFEHTIPSEINGFPVKVIASGAFHHRKEMLTITIPDGIEMIGDYAFTHCSGLKKIVLPNTLTYIGDHSFLGAENLEEILGCNNVAHIGNSAFYGTKWFANQSSDFAILGKTLYRYIGVSKNPIVPISVKFLSSYCFANRDIVSVTLPSKVKVEDGVFYNCRELRSIQGSLENRIPAFCFFGCGMLESINCTPHEIGKFGLYGCRKLQSLNVEKALLGNSSMAKCANLKSVSGSIVRIGKGSFFECAQLRNIDIGSAKILDCFSFYRCSLDSIDLPVCDHLGDYAFGQCEGLKEFSISPSSIIGIGILFGCDNVFKMNVSGRYKVSYYFRYVPKHLSELSVHGDIVDDFNRNCASLKFLNISDVNVFGRWSFYNNTGLENIVFFKVTNIGDWSFACCESLKEVDLPKTVENIGMNGFRYCINLSRIILRSDEIVKFGANALYSTGEKVLVVPEKIRNRYSEDTMWLEYADHLESIETCITSLEE
jgi:hypothetical protein